eukprot:gnl/MRDRNA2_/MRDRNA2_63156_c0_seq1.p1 gnl/MRDRNA2_/MRDRNA2_63156_c0~~gnl/MRDRNA2_/MRDRNA2_63156_c0_seq1.p1  ORF type:complete len:547 (+),score=101.68 gnl/MRDRNA2_/MRDRNA2_63156_c0_seq1:145-1785(+)
MAGYAQGDLENPETLPSAPPPKQTEITFQAEFERLKQCAAEELAVVSEETLMAAVSWVQECRSQALLQMPEVLRAFRSLRDAWDVYRQHHIIEDKGWESRCNEDPWAQYPQEGCLADIELADDIGSGRFGHIRQARLNHTSSGTCDSLGTFCIKVIPKSLVLGQKRTWKTNGKKNVEHLQREWEIHSRVRHCFVPRVVAAMQDEETVYLTMEYASGPTLTKRLFDVRQNNSWKGGIAASEICFYTCEITSALEYLHAHRVIHRDVKLENVVLDAEGHVKVVDFGFTKHLDGPNVRTYTKCGTPWNMAPEIFAGKGYSFPVDWWALGVIAYELLFGSPPFDGCNEKNISAKVLQCDPKYTGEDPEAEAFLQSILVADSAARLGGGLAGASEVTSHPWLSSLGQWEDVSKRKLKPPFVPQGIVPAMTAGMQQKAAAFDKEGQSYFEGIFEDTWGGRPLQPPEVEWQRTVEELLSQAPPEFVCQEVASTFLGDIYGNACQAMLVTSAASSPKCKLFEARQLDEQFRRRSREEKEIRQDVEAVQAANGSS